MFMTNAWKYVSFQIGHEKITVDYSKILIELIPPLFISENICTCQKWHLMKIDIGFVVTVLIE